MPTAPRMSAVAASVAADAVCRLLDGGYLRIYDGGQPESPDHAPLSELLAELQWNYPAFSPAVEGIAEAMPITPERHARATGTATWFRALRMDGVTAVFDGRVGTQRSDLVLDTVEIAAGAYVRVEQYAYEQERR